MLWSVSGIQQMTISIIYYIRWVCIWFTKQWVVTKGFWAEELYVSSWNSTVNNLSMKLQFSSVAQLCLTLCYPMDCSTLDFPVRHQLPELAQTRVHQVNDAIQPSHPLLSPSPTFNLSQDQGLFQWVSSSHQVAKYWSFSFSISPSNEHPGLISFRIDWLDLLAVQGTLKSFLQHHSSKASILWHSALFIAQLSHPYMTTGKTTALIRHTFVGKVMSLLFNMLSRLVIAFLLRSKHLLTSRLHHSPSAVILEPKKIKSLTVSPSICHEVMGQDATILVFWMLSSRPTFSLSSFTFIKRLFSWEKKHWKVIFKNTR